MTRNPENPMRSANSQKSARCGAHCRTTGQPCRSWPIQGKARCRMHGGKSAGRPPTTGRYTKANLRMVERLKFCMWWIIETEGGSKQEFRLRATPERVERLISEILADNNRAKGGGPPL